MTDEAAYQTIIDNQFRCFTKRFLQQLAKAKGIDAAVDFIERNPPEAIAGRIDAGELPVAMLPQEWAVLRQTCSESRREMLKILLHSATPIGMAATLFGGEIAGRGCHAQDDEKGAHRAAATTAILLLSEIAMLQKGTSVLNRGGREKQEEIKQGLVIDDPFAHLQTAEFIYAINPHMVELAQAVVKEMEADSGRSK